MSDTKFNEQFHTPPMTNDWKFNEISTLSSKENNVFKLNTMSVSLALNGEPCQFGQIAQHNLALVVVDDTSGIVAKAIKNLLSDPTPFTIEFEQTLCASNISLRTWRLKRCRLTRVSFKLDSANHEVVKHYLSLKFSDYELI